MNKLVIGLTGGIASGKSAAGDYLESKKFTVVDADVISRKLTEKDSEIHVKLRKLFPDAYPDGVFCRLKLRKLVFDNYVELEKLNSTLHPLIKKIIIQRIEDAQTSIVILIAPLLFEAGLQALCDKTITISCNEKIRFERLMQRNGMTKSTAKKIILSQLTDLEREQKADYVIHNEGSLSEMICSLDKILTEIKKLQERTD